MICKIREVTQSDLKFLPTRQVYTASWGDVDAVIKCHPGDVMHYELGEEVEPRKEVALFDKPTRGTSVEKFREMVHGHVKVRLPTGPPRQCRVEGILFFGKSFSRRGQTRCQSCENEEEKRAKAKCCRTESH